MDIFVPRKRLWHPTEGRGKLLSPEGDVLWEDPDWMPNTLHDAGEADMLNVYLKAGTNPSKYLGLLNDASVAETDGTMTAVTEAKTPATGGYDRQQIATGDWTDDGLVGGDNRFSAAEKTFGAITTANLTATHASLSTTLTSAGLLILTVALSATTTVNIGQFFKYILRWTQQ